VAVVDTFKARTRFQVGAADISREPIRFGAVVVDTFKARTRFQVGAADTSRLGPIQTSARGPSHTVCHLILVL